MDDRVHEHAAVLVEWSARVEPGDDVVVAVSEGAHDLAVAVAERLGEVGATPLFTYASDETTRAYLRAAGGTDGDEDDEDAPDGDEAGGERSLAAAAAAGHERALYEAADVYLSLGGGRNTAATADVPGATRAGYRRARRDVREARLSTDWVSTVHPTRSLAQQAGMAYDEYRDFVYDAVLRDWEALAEEMAMMKRLLDDGSEVRVVAEGTDLRMSIEGRTAVNSAASVVYDSHNLPSGEVFTAPYDTEGEVLFDVPMTVDGRRVRDVRLTFEDGVVTGFEAGENPEVVAELLETDDGARRLGELGIGMNRAIDRFTDNVLFDEKMGDTVHMALGRAYDANLPPGESGNDSAVHQDMILDVSEDARLEVDGEVVQRDGRFRWDEGFQK